MPALVALLLIAAPPTDPWEGLADLVGTWTGRAEKDGREGTVEREVRFVLDGAFLELHTVIEFPATEERPQPVRIEERALVGRDARAGPLVMREFHDSGAVARYELERSADGRTYQFAGEVEAGETRGWRARRIATRDGADRISERLRVAPPGGRFTGVLHLVLTRAPPG